MLSKWDWCVSRSWELRLFLFFFVGSKVEPPSTNGLVFPSFTSTSTTGTAATTTRRRRRRTEKKVARNQTTRENHVLKGSMRSIDSPDATAKTNEEKNTRSSRSYKIGTLLHSRGSNPTKKKLQCTPSKRVWPTWTPAAYWRRTGAVRTMSSRRRRRRLKGTGVWERRGVLTEEYPPHFPGLLFRSPTEFPRVPRVCVVRCGGVDRDDRIFSSIKFTP